MNPSKEGDSASTMARDLGVVWSAEQNQILVYHLIQTEGRLKIEVHPLGDHNRVPATDEVKALVQADLKKRGLLPESP